MRQIFTRAAWMVLAFLAGGVPCVAQDSRVAPAALAADSGELRRGSPQREEREGGVASDHELLDKYVWSTLGLEGVLHATVASGLDQWRESPPVWGTGVTGYARRWASDYAESAIGHTAKYAVARIFRHDPSSTRCECSGFAKRLGYAASSPFMARTRDGTRVVSPATVAGMLAGHVVPASTWYPNRGARDGLNHAATSLASQIGVNVFKEFWRRRSN